MQKLLLLIVQYYCNRYYYYNYNYFCLFVKKLYSRELDMFAQLTSSIQGSALVSRPQEELSRKKMCGWICPGENVLQPYSIPLTHLCKLICTRNLRVWYAFLSKIHVQISCNTYQTKCNSILHKFVQERAQNCIKIWHKKPEWELTENSRGSSGWGFEFSSKNAGFHALLFRKTILVARNRD